MGVLASPAYGSLIPLGEEFQVNTFTTEGQGLAEVCADPSGNFVVVWLSEGDRDGDFTAIAGQRFQEDGTPNGTEFVVNSFTTGGQEYPSICCHAGGEFTVAWTSRDFDGDPGNGVVARLFDS